MATIKAYTDIEQSKKLAEILPLESADMVWISIDDDESFDGSWEALLKTSSLIAKDDNQVSCWSLAALLGVLPDELGDNHFLTLHKEGKEYCCCYEDINGNSFRHTFADNPVDACYEMILKLHELKML